MWSKNSPILKKYLNTFQNLIISHSIELSTYLPWLVVELSDREILVRCHNEVQVNLQLCKYIVKFVHCKKLELTFIEWVFVHDNTFMRVVKQLHSNLPKMFLISWFAWDQFTWKQPGCHCNLQLYEYNSFTTSFYWQYKNPLSSLKSWFIEKTKISAPGNFVIKF